MCCGTTGGRQTGIMPLPQPERLIWVWYGPEETRATAMSHNKLDSLMDVTLGAFLALQRFNPTSRAITRRCPLPGCPTVLAHL